MSAAINKLRTAFQNQYEVHSRLAARYALAGGDFTPVVVSAARLRELQAAYTVEVEASAVHGRSIATVIDIPCLCAVCTEAVSPVATRAQGGAA